MKELGSILIGLIIVIVAFGFLLGFSSRSTAYVQDRQAYYQTLEAQAEDEQVRAVYRMAVHEVFLGATEKGREHPSLRRCLTEPYPRLTRLPWLGASEEENRQWHIRNERACLNELKTEFQANGNLVGMRALEQVHVPNS